MKDNVAAIFTPMAGDYLNETSESSDAENEHGSINLLFQTTKQQINDNPNLISHALDVCFIFLFIFIFFFIFSLFFLFLFCLQIRLCNSYFIYIPRVCLCVQHMYVCMCLNFCSEKTKDT